MAEVVPPTPTNVDSKTLQGWHTVFKPPWEVLVGIGYVDGAEARLTAGQVAILAPAQGEVTADNTDQTIEERELDVAGEPIYVVSTSASDTTNVKIRGITTDGVSENVIVTLNGTTPVQVVSSAADDNWFNICACVNIAGVEMVGVVYTSTASVGIPDNTDSIQTKMVIGTNLAFNAIVMCADDEVLVFPGVDISCSVKDEIVLHLSRRIAAAGVFVKAFAWFAYENATQYHFTTPVVLTARQKMAITVEAGANNTGVAWQMSYYSLNNSNTTTTREGVGRLFE